MHSNVVLGLFLYFPEDKSEYIPAGITMVIFAIIAFLTFKMIIRVSKRQEMKTKDMEEAIQKERETKE
ncbi:hypothetical protein [Bacillus sp. 2205SS5-2]|uniref:hypothetical protein n=1 Tax=Bacillus sp. 2205SS5-2 TaxID=3109031 RepID=UPI0030046063